MPAAVPVVFIHGIGGSAGVWARQMQPFAAAGYAPVALDLPGYGGRPRLDATTFDTLAQDVEAALIERGFTVPFSSATRWAAWSRRPRCAGARSLSRRGAVLHQPGLRQPRGRLPAEVRRRSPAARSMPANPWPIWRPGWCARMMGPQPRRGGPRARHRRHVRRCRPTLIAPRCACLVTFDERAHLAEHPVPVLCLAGEKDPNAPAAVMERMAGKIPSARYVCLPRRRASAEPGGARCVRCGGSRFPAPGASPRQMTVAPLTATQHDSATRRSSIPTAFRLADARSRADRSALAASARRVLAPRAAKHDRDATFPIENFRDMHEEGLLAICVPSGRRRRGRQLPHLLPRRRRARPLLRRHRAVLEHARVLHAVDRRAGRRPDHDRRGARRAQRAPPPALQAHRRRRRHLLPAVLRGRRGRRRRGARSAPRPGRSTAASWSAARRSSPRCRARPTTTACCAPSAPRAMPPAAATRSTWRFPRTPRACRWSATGTRWACAARSRARCCSRTCSCPTTRC